MAAHILAVEDEEAIRNMVRFALERDGFIVHEAETATEALSELADNAIDIALIDWMLPGSSGLDLVRTLRKDELTSVMPIIMLTARTEEHDITAGLDAGADDYVTKPFSPRELSSRIKALLRRSRDFRSDHLLQVGHLVLDAAAVRVTAGDALVELGHTEFKLLRFLMDNPDRVYSRNQLLDHVWGRGTFIEERTIDVHILRLRKSLKPHGLDSVVETVRGVGYRLAAS